jgi:hypothetical protein
VSVVATTALGVGATTVIFALANAVLLRALPVPDPGRLITFEEHVDGALVNSVFSYPALEQ